MRVHRLAVEHVFHRHEGERDFRGELPDFLRIEGVSDIDEFKPERQSDVPVVFRIVWEHRFIFQIPAFPAVVEDDGDCRDVPLVFRHDVVPVLDELSGDVRIL